MIMIALLVDPSSVTTLQILWLWLGLNWNITMNCN